jgi:outer membrane protein assembly factor BamB
MYLAQSNNIVHALDATNGNLIWEYQHELPKMEGSYVKRQLVRARNSIALYGDRKRHEQRLDVGTVGRGLPAPRQC